MYKYKDKIGNFLNIKNFSFLKDKNTTKAELNSWNNSLIFLQKALNGLEEYDIYLEYTLPNSPERIDVVISGENVVFIELKQWSKNNCKNLNSRLITVLGEERLNPAIQVKNYKAHFELHTDFTRNIAPIVFLHNFEGEIENFGVDIFYKGEENKLNHFLKEVLKHPLDFSYNITPQPKLIKKINDIRRNKGFILSSQQNETLLKIIKSKKNSIIIKGMPGSGKSIMALNLHFYLLSRGYSSLFITKNAAPRVVWGEFLDDYVYKLGFVSPNNIHSCDIAIVDEAHRLQEAHVKKILNSSKKAVFFYDDRQVVSCEDIGDDIFKYSAEVLEINEQFRCSASDYVEWIDSVLYGKEFNKNFNYELIIAEDIDEFVKLCKEKDARITAGYCWEWRSRVDPDAFDIEIGNYKWQWNMQDPKDWRRQFKWSVDDMQKEKIGCIHTAQGMEFEYAGVIIGDDLIIKNQKLSGDERYRAKDDFTIKGSCNFDKIIKNTYRVLLSRGIKGTIVFFTNNDVKEYFRGRLGNVL